MTYIRCSCRKFKIGEPPVKCARCGRFLPWVTPQRVKAHVRRALFKKRMSLTKRLSFVPKGDERQRVKRELRHALGYA